MIGGVLEGLRGLVENKYFFGPVCHRPLDFQDRRYQVLFKVLHAPFGEAFDLVRQGFHAFAIFVAFVLAQFASYDRCDADDGRGHGVQASERIVLVLDLKLLLFGLFETDASLLEIRPNLQRLLEIGNRHLQIAHLDVNIAQVLVRFDQRRIDLDRFLVRRDRHCVLLQLPLGDPQVVKRLGTFLVALDRLPQKIAGLHVFADPVVDRTQIGVVAAFSRCQQRQLHVLGNRTRIVPGHVRATRQAFVSITAVGIETDRFRERRSRCGKILFLKQISSAMTNCFHLGLAHRTVSLVRTRMG